MEKAGGYFFGHGARRRKPWLDSSPDCKSLYRAKDGVGMHDAIFSRPKDFANGAFYNQARKVQLAQSFTRSHKSLPGVIGRTAIKEILQRFPLDRPPILQPSNRIISCSQFFSFYRGKPFAEMLEGIWLLLHAVDDKGWLGKGNPRPLRAKGSWFFRRITHYFSSKTSLLPVSRHSANNET